MDDVGQYSGSANYLVPNAPLRPNTLYTVDAEWQPTGGGPSLTQRTSFTTGPTKGNDQIEKALRETAERQGLPGSYTLTRRGKRVMVVGTGLAVGQVMRLRESYVVCHAYWKPFCREISSWHRSVRLRATAQSFAIPAPRHSQTYVQGFINGFASPTSHDYVQGEGTAVVGL